MKLIGKLAGWILIIIVLTLTAASFTGCADNATNTGGIATTVAAGGQTGAASNPINTAGAETPTIASITDSISAIRQLPVLEQINISYINRDQLGGELKQEMQLEYPQEETAVEEKVLKRLGLLDQGADLEETVSQLLGEGILGYYDQETKELKVVSDSDSTSMTSLDELTLAHEITHALQDQSFSLGSLLPTEGSGNDDRDLAVLALIEGDATVAEEEYAAENMGLADAVDLLLSSLGAPLGFGPSSYIEDSVAFPYTQGREFVLAVKDEGGWQAVDAAYAKPPASTEQVMHPEKYAAGEAPVDVGAPELDKMLGDGWSHTYENVIGEFDVLDILRAGGADIPAAAAAAGWGGGSIEFYEQDGGGQALVMVLSWDTVADADEFTVAMARSLEHRTGSSFVFEPGAIPYLEGEGEYWVMAQRGNTAVVISAPERDQGNRMASAILGLS